MIHALTPALHLSSSLMEAEAGVVMRLTAEQLWARFVSADEVPVSSAGRPVQTTLHEAASGVGTHIESF